MRLFQTTYNSLRRGARAVFQFYPERSEHVTLITTCALRCGFTGGMVIDFPNSAKAKKYYLCLFAGQSDTQTQAQTLPQALGATPADIDHDDDDNASGDDDNDNDDAVTVASAAASNISRALQANAAAFANAVQSTTAGARRKQQRGKRKNIKDVDWVLRKKERARARGNAVANDSKYSGRKRRTAF
jgi:18S rRNA (guanine1575-N7)-methyltransferase